MQGRRAKLLALVALAPLVMGVSECSKKDKAHDKIPQKWEPPGVTPPPPACARVTYDKVTTERCLMSGGTEGTSIWTLRCYSDATRDPNTGLCVSNGQNEYCNPDPITHTDCARTPGQVVTPNP